MYTIVFVFSILSFLFSLSIFSFFSMFIFILISFFFFSSRRRHTRSLRDWSSDVCSSDLVTSPIVCVANGGVRSATSDEGYTQARRIGFQTCQFQKKGQLSRGA